MTKEAYLTTLKMLGLLINGQYTAEVLDLSLRQLQRIGAGEAPVPKHVPLLLAKYLRYGLPKPMPKPKKKKVRIQPTQVS